MENATDPETADDLQVYADRAISADRATETDWRGPERSLSDMTDREILEDLWRSHQEILGFVAGISAQVEPIIESIKNSPVAKMMGVTS